MSALGALANRLEDDISEYRWWILFGLITAAIMEVLDTTIINVALPQMAGNLGATSEEIGWVSTGYILANVIVLPVTAWLASRFGRRRYLVASIAIFTAASVMCGLSTSLPMLLFWRIVQGSGGAALLSTAQATIREVFPPHQQAITQAIYVLGIVTAPTIGPTLGGWITDNYSWHWAFFINLPVGITSMIVVSTFLADSKFRMVTSSIDWIGLGLMGVGLGCLQYMLEEGNSKLWFEDGRIVTCGLIALLLLPAFVAWELSPRNKVPIVNIHVLRNGPLAASCVLLMSLGFGLYGGVFIYPLFAQNILHLTPTETGLALFPGGLATAVVAVTTGRLMGHPSLRIPPQVFIVGGLTVVFFSMIWLGRMPPTSGMADAQAALILRGAGLGMLFVPINVAAFSTLKGAEIAQGSSLLNLARQLGGSVGIAALATYLTRATTTARVNMASLMAPGTFNVEQRRQMIEGYLQLERGFPHPVAHEAANAYLVGALQTQANALAYNECFIVIGAVVIVTSPLIFLLKHQHHEMPPAPAEAH